VVIETAVPAADMGSSSPSLGRVAIPASVT
jgi:hypothetical protein